MKSFFLLLVCLIVFVSIIFKSDALTGSCQLHAAFHKSLLKNSFCRPSRVLLKNDDELDSLKLDETKLSASERERLSFIRRLNSEADEIVKAAGFNIDGVKLLTI